MFWVDPMNGPRIDERKLIKEMHFYILDDKEHDTLFVPQQGIKLAQHWVWSMGVQGSSRGLGQCTLFVGILVVKK